jgi:hypothetical protein
MMPATHEVVFLIETPFNARDYERFGIEILEANGFRTDVWDFTPILVPQATIEVPDPIIYSRVRHFRSRAEALSAIKKLPATAFVVCVLGYHYASLPIYRALSRARLRYSLVMTNALPIAPSQGASHSLNRIRKLTPRKLWRSLVLRAPLPLLAVRPAPVALAGGERSIGSHRLITQGTHIVWAHTLDYDIYLKDSENPAQLDGNMGVFLDEYLPFHPDYIRMEIAPPVESEEYYPRLRRLFDSLENKCRVKIVIAAHPRSRYEDHPDYFGGRTLVRGNTAQLVSQSRFVIAHFSTALNFAVLFNKPVLFVTTDRLSRDELAGPSISVMAGWLGKIPINLDQQPTLDWQKELTIDEAAYASYRNAYIKKDDSPERLCWQIFADYLKTSGA